MHKRHNNVAVLQLSEERERANVAKEGIRKGVWRKIVRVEMESESKRWRKKKLVLIMCLKIGEVAHTDRLLLGTWL